MIGSVYNYVIVYTKRDDGGDEVSSTILKQGAIIAENNDKARMIVARLIPADYDDKIDDVDVLVSLFK